jgi:uroporphyrinogen-III synthase
VPVDFIPSTHTGAALAEELPAEGRDLRGARLLIPRALEGREEAAEILRRRGAAVDDIPVYHTEPRVPSAAERSLLADGVDAVLFMSGSAVSAWHRAVQSEPGLAAAARGAVVACIGPATAAEARGLGMTVDVEAARHTAEGLVDALERWFTRARSVPT